MGEPGGSATQDSKKGLTGETSSPWERSDRVPDHALAANWACAYRGIRRRRSRRALPRRLGRHAAAPAGLHSRKLSEHGGLDGRRRGGGRPGGRARGQRRRDGERRVARRPVCSNLHLTDYVFDGEKREPYVESDGPNPQSCMHARSSMGGGRRGASLDRPLVGPSRPRATTSSARCSGQRSWTR